MYCTRCITRKVIVCNFEYLRRCCRAVPYIYCVYNTLMLYVFTYLIKCVKYYFTAVTIIDAERKINTNLNQTNLIVTWKPLINLFCEVLNYTITLSTTDLTMNINVLSSSTLIAIFPNISNSTEYSITIVAVNRASNGSATLKVIMPIPGLFYFYVTYVCICTVRTYRLLFEYKALHCFRNPRNV